ncbi:Rrf2 family transcriptional regulator [Legionella anisa]|uniref:BadM/Rrf2 family transcriptional regulator n=1 Tax=Legionella anisa TaxID=28082 RepID=A0AAX0WRM3_9GAMM|nr:Rrf2 family transcriptional regulator [Legionella anisa]AWN75138.1 Rrf2 family transcriptional regulator [Legionella anisa]KTC68507.1 transcriptional regulator [Legionella anisa]MBN5934485.1 Rrf2 family transcriptional regulator [Legionella anisa]MCW8424646.1 Rrf2 family transcriptional regulator [Legionella anisa]MCW8446235.1 Rrf2 family transcriptional regulator [Legionella anisa]
MQLTQFTDYSLRALIYIALKQNTCTINDIATAYAISHNHLIKIIHNLSKLGIVKTMRGKNGGIVMAENPAEINLKTLVLKLEPHFDLVPCFNKEANCCIAPTCKLRKILIDAQNAFFAILEQFSLADIIQNKVELSPLLNLTPKGEKLDAQNKNQADL